MTVTTSRETVRVLLVDDHALVREGLRAVLACEPELQVVGEAGSAQVALDMAIREHPDVVLLDIRLPDRDGIDTTRRLRAALPDTAVVLLTMYETRGLARRALEAGAMGYLLKDSPAPLIRMAVLAAREGGAVLHHRSLLELLQEGPAQPGAVAEARPPVRMPNLSEREFSVLRLVADGHSNRSIAESLHLSESTVKKYIQSLLTKMHVADRTEAAVKALRSGLLR